MIQDEKWTAPPTFTVLPICYNCTSMPAIIFTTGWQNLLHILLIQVSKVARSPRSLWQHYLLHKRVLRLEHLSDRYILLTLYSKWDDLSTKVERSVQLGCWAAAPPWPGSVEGQEFTPHCLMLLEGTKWRHVALEPCYVWTTYNTTWHYRVISHLVVIILPFK